MARKPSGRAEIYYDWIIFILIKIFIVVRISVNEFAEYDKETLREFIELQEDTEYEIVIPREYMIFTFENVHSIALEYIYWAWAGEILDRAVKKFSYTVPDAYSKEIVQFRVEIEDEAEFIEALYAVVLGTFNDADNLDEHTAFTDAAFKFYTEFHEDSTVPATIGLLGVAFRLSDEEEEDGEGSEEDEE